MNRPVEPVPEGFGLTRETLASVPLPLFRKSNLALVWTVYVVSSLAAFAALRGLGVMVPLGVFPVVFLVTMLVTAGLAMLEVPLRSRLSPLFKAKVEFERECRAYRFRMKEFLAWEMRRAEDFWRSLDGIAFENELARLYIACGWRVEKTKRSGDGGVDLIVHDGKLRTIVQCKAHSKKIAINTARELVACLQDFQADRAIIACLEGVTKPVQDYIRDRPITVMDVKAIVELQRQQR